MTGKGCKGLTFEIALYMYGGPGSPDVDRYPVTYDEYQYVRGFLDRCKIIRDRDQKREAGRIGGSTTQRFKRIAEQQRQKRQQDESTIKNHADLGEGN